MKTIVENAIWRLIALFWMALGAAADCFIDADENLSAWEIS